MGRPRKPIDLQQAQRRLHRSKKEVEERVKTTVKAEKRVVLPPKGLTGAKKEKFIQLAQRLCELEIMSDLDADALARYIQSEEKYQKYDQMTSKLLKEVKDAEGIAGAVVLLEKTEGLRDKAFKQCRVAASDLGLTITARCRLTAPPAAAPQDPNADLFGDTA